MNTFVLNLDKAWHFDSPGPLSAGARSGLADLVDRICPQGDRKANLELFKSHFAAAAGLPHHLSSSASWAASDLVTLMDQAASNAPMFIKAFVSACEELKVLRPEIVVPNIDRINRVLAEGGAGYMIQGDTLVAISEHPPIALPERTPSLDEQAKALMDRSLVTSEQALSEGRGRQAVQELLWLLETVSTAFRGLPDGSIQGRYFNKIVSELQIQGSGTHQKQILSWMMTLHGFLSSPTGGGIRHGLDLADGVAMQINEARLYCNLIRSYLRFLIDEHERLSQR